MADLTTKSLLKKDCLELIFSLHCKKRLLIDHWTLGFHWLNDFMPPQCLMQQNMFNDAHMHSGRLGVDNWAKK